MTPKKDVKKRPRKPRFQEGDRVLCFHGPFLYKAECVNVSVKYKKVKYQVRYFGVKGRSSGQSEGTEALSSPQAPDACQPSTSEAVDSADNWDVSVALRGRPSPQADWEDEWLPQSKLLKYNQANLKKLRELNRAMQGEAAERSGARPVTREKASALQRQNDEASGLTMPKVQTARRPIVRITETLSTDVHSARGGRGRPPRSGGRGRSSGRRGRGRPPGRTGAREWSLGETGGRDRSLGETGGRDRSLGETGGRDRSLGETGGRDRSLGETGGRDRSLGETGGRDRSLGETGGRDRSLGESGGTDRSLGETGGRDRSLGETGGRDRSLGETGGRDRSPRSRSRGRSLGSRGRSLGSRGRSLGSRGRPRKRRRKSLLLPRKKKVPVTFAAYSDSDIEPNQEFLKKATVKVPIPEELKPWLMDDWDMVVKQNQLFRLPAKKNVDSILQDYEHYERISENADAKWMRDVREIVVGIKAYFDVMLGSQLLYRFERPQYAEILENLPGVPMSQVYGAPHLLRLFVKIEEMLTSIPLEEHTLNLLLQHLHRFLKYLANNFSVLFSTDEYDVATPEYWRRAYL